MDIYFSNLLFQISEAAIRFKKNYEEIKTKITVIWKKSNGLTKEKEK